MKMLNFILHRDRAVYTRLETMPELEKRLVRKLGMWSCLVMVVYQLITTRLLYIGLASMLLIRPVLIVIRCIYALLTFSIIWIALHSPTPMYASTSQPM
jgi:hypothetical protein